MALPQCMLSPIQEARALDLYFLSIGLIAGGVLPLSASSKFDEQGMVQQIILLASKGAGLMQSVIVTSGVMSDVLGSSGTLWKRTMRTLWIGTLANGQSCMTNSATSLSISRLAWAGRASNHCLTMVRRSITSLLLSTICPLTANDH